MKATALVLTVIVNGLISSQGIAALDTDALIDAMASRAGIDLAAQHDRLLAGELVTSTDGRFEVEEEEIAAAQIMYLPVQVADVAALLAKASFHGRAKKVQELKSVDDQVNIASLDDKAAKKLRNAEPGDDVNFSAAEFDQLGAAGDDPTATLNSILTARYKAYRQSGLGGIAEYQRKRDSINVAEYLKENVKSFKVAPQYFPEFYAALLEYPNKGQSLQHRLFAVASDVEGEPQYILTHWMIDSSDNYVVGTQRQFYVNHTYDTLQITFTCLPYHEGVLVVMLNQTFTDKVAGFASGIAHRIGRGRVADAIAETFDLIRTAVK